jgi:hypothetical protein
MSDSPLLNPARVVPVGTQVVTRVAVPGTAGSEGCPRGAVGVIVVTPTAAASSYLLRFPNGIEAMLSRHEFSIRKHVQRDVLRPGNSHDTEVLYNHVMYRCVVGSRAYGLDEPGSDVDRRGIYLPPAELHWSLGGVPEQLENPDTQEVYWELQKFLELALKANPNVLECLYTPMIEFASALTEELLSMRSAFISQVIYQTYNGYVMSQFKKHEQELFTRGEVKWKHVMHLIRLLLSGIVVLREGFVPVDVLEHREGLLAIRRGIMPWKEVDQWRLQLHAEFDAAFRVTSLPEAPDYVWANTFLINARRSMVDRREDEDAA